MQFFAEMHAALRERGGREGGDGDAGADDLRTPISKRILYPGISFHFGFI